MLKQKNKIGNTFLLNSFFVLFHLYPLFSFCQTTTFTTKEINQRLSQIFQDSLTDWQSIVNKATNENKYIYIYCHKLIYHQDLERMIMPIKTAKLLDSNFIAIDLYFDSKPCQFTTTKCTKEFEDTLVKKYSIKQFPTNLFFDKTGKPVDKNIHSANYDTNCFYNELKYFLNGKGHYYTMLEQFKNGNRTKDLVTQLYYITRFDFDKEIDVSKEFINTLLKKKTYTKNNAEIILEIAEGKNECFEHLFLNRKKWYRVIGKEKVDVKIYNEMFFSVESEAAFYCHHKPVKTCLEETRQRYLKQLKGYEDYDSLIHLFTIVDYSLEWKEWDNFIANIGQVIDIWDKFGMNDIWMHKYAKEIAERTNDKALLKKTIRWVEDTFKASNNAEYLNTYSKLLAKLNFL